MTVRRIAFSTAAPDVAAFFRRGALRAGPGARPRGRQPAPLPGEDLPRPDLHAGRDGDPRPAGCTGGARRPGVGARRRRGAQDRARRRLRRAPAQAGAGGDGAQPLRHHDRRAAHRPRALRPGGAARGALRRGARQALPAGRLVAAAARPRAAGLRGRRTPRTCTPCPGVWRRSCPRWGGWRGPRRSSGCSSRSSPARRKSRGAWTLKGAGRLAPRQLARLQALLEMRDELARAWDRPPFMVLGNQTLIDWAQAPPASRRDLVQTPGAGRSVLERVADRALEALERAAAVPEEECPRPEPSRRTVLGASEASRLARLRAVREETARRLGLAPGLLVNGATLEELARDGSAGAGLLKNWQREALGARPSCRRLRAERAAASGPPSLLRELLEDRREGPRSSPRRPRAPAGGNAPARSARRRG